MAKNIPLTTIGVKVSWAVETTAGTRPTTGYKVIHGIYSTPDLNIAPSTVDVTSFDDTVFTRKAPVLKDIPDNMEYGVKYGKQFKKTGMKCVPHTQMQKRQEKKCGFAKISPMTKIVASKTHTSIQLSPPSFQSPHSKRMVQSTQRLMQHTQVRM